MHYDLPGGAVPWLGYRGVSQYTGEGVGVGVVEGGREIVRDEGWERYLWVSVEKGVCVCVGIVCVCVCVCVCV